MEEGSQLGGIVGKSPLKNQKIGSDSHLSNDFKGPLVVQGKNKGLFSTHLLGDIIKPL